MRDRSGWYRRLAQDLGPWPESQAGTRPGLLCQVELGLRLMETLDPDRSAEGVWTLLSGYPFARATGIAPGPAERLALTSARHLLWPMRRRRMWLQSLETYAGFPERLRGYRLPESGRGPARRVDPPVASHRFSIYDAALSAVPAFATNPLPWAGEGSHRFLERRRQASVTIPPELVAAPPAGHDLEAGRPGASRPIDVPIAELLETARWMDEEEHRRNLPPGNWRNRLADLRLDARTADRTGFEPAARLHLDGLTHMVGMVGSGKSTLMTLIAVWAHHRNLRTTLIVGDVAEQLTLTEMFTGLGLDAAPVQGATTREQHAQRLHRRLAARGARSLLAHTDRAFRHLSTACPLDAQRGMEAIEPLRYADAPCGGLRPGRRAAGQTDESAAAKARQALRRARGELDADGLSGQEEESGPPHACPLWGMCPRHGAARDLVDALIWVANPASLVNTAVPRQLNAERLRYLELAALRSDIVIVDEADRVQMQLDRAFAPSATLVTKGPESWLDQLQTHEIDELSRQGRLPLTDPDVERWSSALDVVGAATDRLYAMLIGSKDLRDWVQVDYFSAWTLQERLLHEWYPPAEPPPEDFVENEGELFRDEEELDPDGLSAAVRRPHDTYASRRAEVTELLDAFRDDPLGDRGPYGTDTDGLTRLTHDLLHTLNGTRTRRRVRVLLERLLRGAPGPEERPKPRSWHGGAVTEAPPLSDAWFERSAQRLEFTLILAALHQRLDRVTFLWPQVEAALHLDTTDNDLVRRPPLDYAPLVPESPMGNVLGFQYLVDSRGPEGAADGRTTGTLRFFRCAGVGRELLLTLPRLGADPARRLPGPHVLLMSATSWAGTSTRAHVLAPVEAVLKPGEQALRAIRETVFTTLFLYDQEGRPIRLSGTRPDDRSAVLRTMVDKLAKPGPGGDNSHLQQELNRIPDDRRRRALLLVGSYREAASAAARLDEIPRWQGKVRVLVADDAELGDGSPSDVPAAGQASRPGAVRRGDLASFADDVEAELLVAPLLAIERGHNILTVPQLPGETRVAAFGTVFFLARPHPVPDDLSLAVFGINDWATRFLRSQPGLPEGTFAGLVSSADELDDAGRAFRATARRVWRRLLSRPYIYSALSDAEQQSFAWDQLVAIWQVIGRLVRGGVPARVVFVDAAFAPALAAARSSSLPGDALPRWLGEQGLLWQLREVLAPYFADRPALRGFHDPADPALVRMLYQPLYEALCRLDAPAAITP
ncbi:hypothetical protein [Streptomyces caatingaensis]|uniref:pPIWI-RE three-gene island domain-containing protein n=1 Tax=Streptomyces caatingaensis TaxID=1678637 RepID=A0A0K9XLD1_9ACTN|nr:hypothetical protein [Streptomyces caatingaensis]KNB54209.1 hypothetical protein AC230_03095 [Streptomyces caatingaensis]